MLLTVCTLVYICRLLLLVQYTVIFCRLEIFVMVTFSKAGRVVNTWSKVFTVAFTIAVASWLLFPANFHQNQTVGMLIISNEAFWCTRNQGDNNITLILVICIEYYNLKVTKLQ